MAAKSKLRFQYGRKKNGQWYWHLRARNGEIVAENEGLKTRASVMKVFRLLRDYAASAELVVVTF